MTEDRLQELKDLYRRLGYLTSWLAQADRTPKLDRKLSALFEVGGYVSETTLQRCYDLIRPELDAAHEGLQKEWNKA